MNLASGRGGLRHAVLGALLVCGMPLLSACAAPPRPPGVLGEAQGSDTQTLARQLDAITQDPAPHDGRRVVLTGAALHSREDVFDRDIRATDAALRSLHGSAYRSVLLSNIRIPQAPRALPLATIDHLDDAFDSPSSQRRPADGYIVLLSTHGAPGLPSFDFLCHGKPVRHLAGMADRDSFRRLPLRQTVRDCAANPRS